MQERKRVGKNFENAANEKKKKGRQLRKGEVNEK